MLRRLLLLVALVLATGTAAVAQGAPDGRFTLRGTVSHVVDGDTLDVWLVSGRSERVRLIGIDTPEVGECFSGTATGEARRLAHRQRVVLKGDATQATRDRYGRLLAYVWLPGGKDLGYQLVARGTAKVYVYDRPFERLSAYRRAEQLGRRLGRSLWTSCGRPTPAPPTPRGGCDPSYPDVCIPPPPPDLDCADVQYSGFSVVGADAHRFDGDGDGVGCEG